MYNCLEIILFALFIILVRNYKAGNIRDDNELLKQIGIAAGVFAAGILVNLIFKGISHLLLRVIFLYRIFGFLHSLLMIAIPLLGILILAKTADCLKINMTVIIVTGACVVLSLVLYIFNFVYATSIAHELSGGTRSFLDLLTLGGVSTMIGRLNLAVDFAPAVCLAVVCLLPFIKSANKNR